MFGFKWQNFVFTSVGALLLLVASSSAQEPQKCLEPGRLEVLKKQISEAKPLTLDQKLRDQLLEASEEFAIATRASTAEKLAADTKKVIDEGKKNKSDKPSKKQKDLDTLRQENIVRVCSILNKTGWPMRSLVYKEGVDAFLVLVSRALPIAMQVELYPLVIEAFEKEQIERGQLLAGYVDRLRLNTGQKQLFGTQVYVRDGFLVIAPIEQPSKVEQRRAEFKMDSLRSYEKFLESTYQKLLIRAVMEPIAAPTVIALGRGSIDFPSAVDESGEEVVKVKTSLISFDVVIPDASDPRTSALEKSDFRVYENDRPVDIEFFSKTAAAFDIVLLLDLSGSTADKVDLIRKSTKRFIAMKRPHDRLAIVTFDESQTTVSELESDAAVLQNRVGKLRGGGGTRVWDAIKYCLDMLEQPSENGRRKAIVMMSDGVDNQLNAGFFGASGGSRLSYADLIGEIQRGTTSIFPIYLDTEGPNPYFKSIYANARLGLKYIADQSAGNMYYAKKLEDLEDVYNRVLKDVGTVYTLGFTSPGTPSDSNWHTLRVEVPSLPGVKLKHRPGYFIK